MRRAALLAAIAAALVAAAVLGAATQAAPVKPVVTTGVVRDLKTTTVTLVGTVNPKGDATTYFFEYGPSNGYGSQTPSGSAGAGTHGVKVTADLTGLTPGATYHYRLVGTNGGGTTSGADRTFTAKTEPLVFAVKPARNPVPYGATTTLAGRITGTGAAGQALTLMQNPFPYVGGFKDAGAQTTADAAGNFSIGVPALTANTQFRVATADKKANSAIVLLQSLVAVRLTVSTNRLRRGRHVRFFGTVTPAEDGAPFLVQRRSNGRWSTVSHSFVRPLSAASSRFSRRVRITRSGLYRVYVHISDGAHVSNGSTGRRLFVK